MKKDTVASSKSSSSTACATKIRIANPSRIHHNSKDLSTLLNRKSKSSHKLEASKANKYKIDDMTPKELHECLDRVDKNFVEPFTFLSNIMDENIGDRHVSIERTKPTEIDLQLAALKRRVRLNQSLLERTNEHVKEINFLVEKNATIASRELNYDDKDSEQTTASGDASMDGDSALNAACPAITELQRTIKATKDMLDYVKKICNDEIPMTDVPKELTNRMTSLDLETKEKKNTKYMN